MGKKQGHGGRDFSPHYGGEALLGRLLADAGSPYSVEQVIEGMKEAIADGRRAAEVIPELFAGEPYFDGPEAAQLTFQNLLGLWELLSTGKALPKGPVERPVKARKPEPVHPGAFAQDGPDEAWVERTWRYLEDIPERERTRLRHSFENRQDALIGHLDEAGLPDDSYAVARHLLFELHAMLELGGGPVGSVATQALRQGRGDAGEVPSAFGAYADEALFEAQQDEDAPLSAAEAAKVRELIDRALAAMWASRRA